MIEQVCAPGRAAVIPRAFTTHTGNPVTASTSKQRKGGDVASPPAPGKRVHLRGHASSPLAILVAAALAACRGASPPPVPAAPEPAAAPQAVEPVFRMLPLAPGVYVAEVVARPPVYAFSNSLVVLGDDGVLVVDTQASRAAARSLIAEIRNLTSAPVRWVVNTHWHGDHVYGNEAYRSAFPQVQFLAHASLRDDVTARTAARRASEADELPPSIDARRQWLVSGKGPDGRALTPEDREAVARSLELRLGQLAELRELELIGPTRTFRDRLEVNVGGRTVRLLHFGPAHTGGDVVAHLPAEGVVAVGDLLEHDFPYLADGHLPGWRATLDSVAALRASAYVLGHGPVQRDRVMLDDFRGLLGALVAGSRAAACAPDPTGDAGRLAAREAFQARYGVSPAAFDRGFEGAVQHEAERLRKAGCGSTAATGVP